MMHVFDTNECVAISNGSITTEQIQRAKNKVIEYLQSNDITFINTNTRPNANRLIHMIHNTSTPDANVWHYDDVILINFIINIRGEGTRVLIGDEVVQIPQGYGYFIVGEEGYSFLQLRPVLHCAPNQDTNQDTNQGKRTMLKIMLEGNYDVPNYLSGQSVCSYDSKQYKERKTQLNEMFATDLQKVQRFKIG